MGTKLRFSLPLAVAAPRLGGTPVIIAAAPLSRTHHGRQVRANLTGKNQRVVKTIVQRTKDQMTMNNPPPSWKANRRPLLAAVLDRS